VDHAVNATLHIFNQERIMAEAIAKTFSPALFSKLEKKKQDAAGNPLSSKDINSLLSMHFNNRPLYQSIESLYSDEYRQALASGKTGEELEKIRQFREPTEQELNLLYCDIHTREEKINYSNGNQSG
jgi:hypothetical protein